MIYVREVADEGHGDSSFATADGDRGTSRLSRCTISRIYASALSASRTTNCMRLSASSCPHPAGRPVVGCPSLPRPTDLDISDVLRDPNPEFQHRVRYETIRLFKFNPIYLVSKLRMFHDRHIGVWAGLVTVGLGVLRTWVGEDRALSKAIKTTSTHPWHRQ